MALIQRPGPELTTAELYDLLRLRTAVFVVEQSCPYQELDGRDLEPGTTHLWLADGAGVTAALRLLTETAGVLRVGRVVTRSDCRGDGLASRLLEGALQLAGPSATVLDAQSHLRTFYERFGYTVAGPEHLEDGIPHLPMARPGTAGRSKPT